MVQNGKKKKPEIGSLSGATLSPELKALAGQVGDLMHLWGLKRIHGRIWTLLFVSEEPLDAGAIQKKLKISKGLCSMTLRELVSLSLVHVVESRAENGRSKYAATQDVRGAILTILAARQQTLLAKIGVSLKRLVGQAPKEPGKSEQTEHVKKRLSKLKSTLQFDTVDPSSH